MSRLLWMTSCFALLVCTLDVAADTTVIADFTFDDEASLVPFTLTGTPTVSGGQLQLDGNSFLEIDDPLDGATENYIVEAIVTASSFDTFDFAFARHDPEGQHEGNNGQGLLFQDFGAGEGQIAVLNSFCCMTHGFSIGTDPIQLEVDTPTAVAAVQFEGATELYVNGEMIFDVIVDREIIGFPTILGIGTHPFDGVVGAFDGTIDRVRLSTFEPGEFDESDLLQEPIGVLGDFNGNGILDAADIDLLSEEVRAGTNSRAFDLTGDGLVDASDREHWVVEIRNTYFGDSNLDDEFNSSDFVAVFTTGEYEDNVDANSTWSTGDWNGDTEFDSSDFVTAFTAGGYELGPRGAVAVPEPTSLVVLSALVIVTPLIRRRTRQ